MLDRFEHQCGEILMSINFPTEKQRIIYVACSRPRQILAMDFPLRVTPAEIHEPFGQQVLISPL
jgi:hypothetical protein